MIGFYLLTKRLLDFSWHLSYLATHYRQFPCQCALNIKLVLQIYLVSPASLHLASAKLSISIYSLWFVLSQCCTWTALSKIYKIQLCSFLSTMTTTFYSPSLHRTCFLVLGCLFVLNCLVIFVIWEETLKRGSSSIKVPVDFGLCYKGL